MQVGRCSGIASKLCHTGGNWDPCPPSSFPSVTTITGLLHHRGRLCVFEVYRRLDGALTPTSPESPCPRQPTEVPRPSGEAQLAVPFKTWVPGRFNRNWDSTRNSRVEYSTDRGVNDSCTHQPYGIPCILTPLLEAVPCSPDSGVCRCARIRPGCVGRFLSYREMHLA
jgi:hypothetical protein